MLILMHMWQFIYIMSNYFFGCEYTSGQNEFVHSA